MFLFIKQSAEKPGFFQNFSMEPPRFSRFFQTAPDQAENRRPILSEGGCRLKKKILLCLIAALLLSAGSGLLCAAAEAKWPEGSSGGKKTNGK